MTDIRLENAMPELHSLFNTVPKSNFLDLIGKDPKKTVDFLDFDTNDVSKATNTAKASIRYDDKIPKELKQRLAEIALVCELVANFFDGDAAKTALWFKIPNPALGNIAPRDMLRFGQFEKLRAFISNALEGNTP